MSAKELAKLLDDPRPAVRHRAIQVLADRKEESWLDLTVVVLGKRTRTTEARRNAIWALTRIDSPKARSSVRHALSDPEESVRQVALHSVSLWRDGEALVELIF